MYCTQCGKLVPDEAKFCTACGAPAATVVAVMPPEPSGPSAHGDDRGWADFFNSMESELLKVTTVSPERFEFNGERKVKALLSRTTIRYQAVATLDSASRIVRWWEKLSESSFGLAPESFGTHAEKRVQKGTAVEIKKTVQTPGGAYAYHYGDLRIVVENKARENGWAFELLVRRP